MTALFSNKRSLLPVAIMAMLAVFGFSLVTPAVVLADETTTNHDNVVTSTETKEALQDVPGILGSSDQVTAKTDADSTVVASVAGSTVDMPKDPE